MCGIAGHLTFTGHPDSNLVSRMSARLAHRGPDDQGSYSDDQVALGHRRLAIIDLSPEGAQPMAHENQTLWIVYNGEIYNYIELREELAAKGHTFQTRTDTEVILHAYEEWGHDCLSHFNGMWAFALWDTNRKKLFCARDRFGIKPFYYTVIDNSFLFASEIKALLEHPKVGKVPNDRMLRAFLAHGLMDHTGDTMFDGIFQLRPATSMTVSVDGSMTKNQYWDLTVNSACCSGRGVDEVAASRLKELLVDAIRLRLRSDVSVGTCLSGGIDSSTITLTINDLIRRDHPESVGDRQKTFSIVFDEKDCDERRFIDAIVQVSGVDASRDIPRAETLPEDLDRLLYHQDEPFISLSIYAQFAVMRLASGKVKVVLDGQGADEQLGGYLAYQVPYIGGLIRSLHPFRALKELLGFCRHHRGFLGYARKQRSIRARRRTMIRGDVPPSRRYRGSLDEVLFSDLFLTNLPALLHWEDRNSMAFSIESRVPFLDYRVAEYLSSLPLDQKIRQGITKYVLRRSMKGFVPDLVRCRMDKMGFVTPEEVWMTGPLKDMVQTILFSSQFNARPYWNAINVKESHQAFLSGAEPYSPDFWRIFCAELWLRMFFDHRANLFPEHSEEHKGQRFQEVQQQWNT